MPDHTIGARVASRRSNPAPIAESARAVRAATRAAARAAMFATTAAPVAMDAAMGAGSTLFDLVTSPATGGSNYPLAFPEVLPGYPESVPTQGGPSLLELILRRIFAGGQAAYNLVPPITGQMLHDTAMLGGGAAANLGRGAIAAAPYVASGAEAAGRGAATAAPYVVGGMQRVWNRVTGAFRRESAPPAITHRPELPMGQPVPEVPMGEPVLGEPVPPMGEPVQYLTAPLQRIAPQGEGVYKTREPETRGSGYVPHGGTLGVAIDYANVTSLYNKALPQRSDLVDELRVPRGVNEDWYRSNVRWPMELDAFSRVAQKVGIAGYDDSSHSARSGGRLFGMSHRPVKDRGGRPGNFSAADEIMGNRGTTWRNIGSVVELSVMG